MNVSRKRRKLENGRKDSRYVAIPISSDGVPF